MNHIYMAIYLIYHIILSAIGVLHKTYFDPNTFITIWCYSAKSPGVDNLTQSGDFPIRQKKLFGISQNIVVCLLASGSGGRLNRSIETLLFVQEEQAIMCNIYIILQF